MNTRSRALRIRSRGDDVERVHTLLRTLGYTIGSGETDRRYFGAETREAVRTFQSLYGLAPGGVVDERTAAAIEEAVRARGEAETAGWRSLSGRAVDEASGRPLAGATVSVVEADGDTGELGAGVTDEHGLFTLTYRPPEEAPPTDANVRMRLRDAFGAELYETTIARPTGDFLELVIPPGAGRGRSALAEEVAEVSGTALSARLLRALERRGVSTLADVLATGGLGRLGGLGLRADHPALAELEAHAALSLLPTEPSVNAGLVAAGYRSVLDIAATSPASFAESVRKTVDDEAAVELHAVADAQAKAIENALTELRTNVNGASEIVAAALETAAPRVCGCARCQDATSPLAYVADLLEYTIRNLKRDGAAVTLSGLADRFHQPFAALPASCELADERVRRIRIAIEVLRAHLSIQTAPRSYLEETYKLLLEGIGTSFDELRDARSAKPRERAAIAARLGFDLVDPGAPAGTRPDRLDELFIDPTAAGALTEAELERRFGLRATTRDPASSENEPDLLLWRRTRLVFQWTEEDWPGLAPGGGLPLVDPDNLGPSDFQPPAPGTINPALKLFEERQIWVATQMTDLDDGRTNAEAAGQNGYDTVLQDPLAGLDMSISELLALRDQRDQGTDIGPQLGQLGLTNRELDYLARVAELDASTTAVVLDSEWEDAFSILVQARKRREVFQQWRQQEFTATGGPITLTSTYFRLRPSPAQGGFPARPHPWRGSVDVRREWVRKLRNRIEQERALVPSLEETVAGIEEITLPWLREYLVLALPYQPGVERATWATRRFQVDVATGACATTTRAAQAIETLQGVLYGARHGLLDDPSLDIDNANFDEEWRWIGSYATWRAAMLVFLYPENTLRPTLRRRASPAFRELVERFRTLGGATPGAALEAARGYGAYFADTSSHALVAQYERAVALTGREGPSVAPPTSARRVLNLAHGGTTGKLYSAQFTRLLRPSLFQGVPPVQVGVADQTFWQEVPRVPPDSEVIGVLPYEDGPGEGRLGVYLRLAEDSTARYLFTSNDGARWLATPLDLGGPPPTVVRSAQLGVNVGADARLATLDLDGDGAAEAVVIGAAGPDGRRAVRVLRAREGGLLVEVSQSLPPGWDLPSEERPPVFRVELRDRLVLVNRASSEIGVFGLAADGTYGILWSAGNVPQPDGTSGWPVQLGTGDNPTVFVAADLDGAGKRLLAFERVPSGNESPVQTTVAVLDWLGDSFALGVLQELPFHLSATPFLPNQNLDIRWETFLPVRGGFGPAGWEGTARQDVLVLATHTVFWRPIGEADWDETHRWLALLRWDQSSNQFLLPPPVLYWGPGEDPRSSPPQDIRGAGGPDWQLGFDDEFLAVDLVPQPAGLAVSQDIVVWNPSRQALGVLSYQPDGRLAVAWEAIDRIGAWDLRAGDRFTAADIDGDGGGELVVVSADGRSLAVLRSDELRQLAATWSAVDRVRSPQATSAQDWLLTPGSGYLGADVDSDGYDELVARGGDGRLALLRGIPAPRQPQESTRLAPVGVTLFDVVPKRTTAELESRRIAIRSAYLANLRPMNAVDNGFAIEYLDEAYFFVPVELALRLQASGEYTAALDWLASVYDYEQPPLPASAPPSTPQPRKIAYKLVHEESLASGFERAAAFLQDPLDPHGIAVTRRNSYTKFTLLTAVRCLLGVAGAEYTRATSESIPRARALYLKTLELLDVPELRQRSAVCADLIGTLEIEVGDPEWVDIWLGEVIAGLARIESYERLAATVAGVQATIAAEGQPVAQVTAARELVARALAEEAPEERPFAAVLEANANARRTLATAAVIEPSLARTVERLGADIAAAFRADRNGLSAEATTEPLSEGTSAADEAIYRRFLRPPEVFEPDGTIRPGYWVPAPSFSFCITPNPAIETARSHAELALRKIRSCRNIAGLDIHPEPYASPRAAEADALGVAGNGLPARPLQLRPLPYRYSSVIARAKELATLARDMEQSMLASIQSGDQEAYHELMARQDLALAEAGVRLKDLQLTEAIGDIAVAELQRERAEIQTDHYDDLLEAPTSVLEGLGVAALQSAALFQFGSIPLGGGLGAAAQGLSTQAQVFLTLASFERRRQEWQFAGELGAQDIRIGQQQIQIAEDRARVAAQDRAIAALEVEHASNVLDFLTQKFTNVALYEWMSGVLEGVYRFFLQQATSMAQVAEAQLAFERQEIPPAFIKADYWEPPTSVFAAGDRRGLTGSARLLRDITELDQYAFQTNERKLHLTKRVSLAQLDPFLFEQFRQTGVLDFATPMSLFDRDFPGHLLRLVKRVRASVIAIVPPTEGIHATLSTTGTSRVVIGTGPFETVTVQRGPETVALTTPIGSTGFEVEPQSELVEPFYGIGADATWQFSLPKPANQFDYPSIADVEVEIEYTAKSNADYRERVIANLDPRFSGERPFSLRNELQDQWFDLHNPDQTATPMAISFRTERDDFPPNLDDLDIEHVTLYFASAVGAPPANWSTLLRTTLSFRADGATETFAASAVDPRRGVVTTRSGVGSTAWADLKNMTPVGTWGVALPTGEQTRDLFRSEALGDVLLIITYGGALPEWPEG